MGGGNKEWAHVLFLLSLPDGSPFLLQFTGEHEQPAMNAPERALGLLLEVGLGANKPWSAFPGLCGKLGFYLPAEVSSYTSNQSNR